MKQVLCGLLFLTAIAGTASDDAEEKFFHPVGLEDGIDTGSLSATDCDIPLLKEFLRQIGAGDHGAVDSLLIARGQTLVLEAYFNKGAIDRPHMMMSITKNMTSFGVIKAFELGLLKGPEALLLDHYPDLDRSTFAEGSEKITIGDCLTMRSGIQADPEKQKAWKKRHPDGVTMENQVDYLLSTSLPINPGKTYRYQGADPDLLGNLIHHVSGMHLADFLEKHYFTPMKIERKSWTWNGLDRGLPGCGAGMHATSRVLMKFGMLTLREGLFGKERIVEAERIREALQPRIPDKVNYGYFWRTHDFLVKEKAISCHSCRGAGGQFILVMPELDLVVVVTNGDKQQRKPLAFTESSILPAFVRGEEGTDDRENRKAAD